MIEFGKYLGEGEYITFDSEQQLPIECNIEISSDESTHLIEGSWFHHAGQPKKSFSIFVQTTSKYLGLVNLKYADLELIGYVTIGSLPFVLSAKSKESGAIVCAALYSIENGYYINGIVSGNGNMHQWRVNIYESGKTAARENVISIDKRE